MDSFKKACQNVVDNQELPELNWAVNYAKYGLTIEDKHEAEVQTLYILNNLDEWYGKVAKETKKLFNDFIKEYLKELKKL